MAEEAHTSPTTAPIDGDPDEKGKNTAEDDEDIEMRKTQDLVATIQEKLEFLLSKTNLVEDSFIQQHMNAQMYIPLAALVRHHSLRSLGEDPEAIISAAREAAQGSDKVGMDSELLLVRPLNLKPRRNTLILHDLPDDLPEDELKALFEGSPESESFCSLKPDVNNTAFVSFKTDEAAQNAALWLRSQKFQGAEIKCAVKSEHFVRSFFPASGTPIMGASAPYMNPQQAMWGYPSNMWGVQGGWYDGSDPSISNAGWGDTGAWMPDAQQMGQKDGDGKGKSPGKGKGRNKGKSGGFFPQDGQMEMNQMEAGSDMGTPLMGPAMSLDPDADGELAEPGYTHEYRKYTRQYIIEVCNKMEEIIKPASFEKCEKNEVALFRQEPNKDWAPLPTPMSTFSANFFDDRRGSEASEFEKGKGKGKRKGKGEQDGSEAWGPGKGRTSRTESHDYEESDWAHGDSSWWRSDSGRRPSSWSDWDGSTYGQKQWVKKDADAEQEADGKSGENAGGPHKMSWADKVKAAASLGPSDQQKRWVEKSKPTDAAKAKEQEKDSAAAAAPEKASDPGFPALAVGGAEAKPAAAEPAAEAAAGSPAGPERKMSWADKARQAANK